MLKTREQLIDEACEFVCEHSPVEGDSDNEIVVFLWGVKK